MFIPWTGATNCLINLNAKITFAQPVDLRSLRVAMRYTLNFGVVEQRGRMPDTFGWMAVRPPENVMVEMEP